MRSIARLRFAARFIPFMILGIVPGLTPASSGAADGLKAPEQIAAIERPTALDFTPEGNLYAASQGGKLYLIPGGEHVGDGTGTPGLALDLSDKVCDVAGEQGLLGVAVDPAFTNPTNRFVYLYYSAKKGRGCGETVNRVSRFAVRPDGKLLRGSELALIDNIPTPGANGNHNGGDLQFDRDGFLYVSVGDGACSLQDADACQYENGNARLKNVLLGKILRITKTGGIPPTNPHLGEGTARCSETGMTANRGTWCREIWATGLRNPFRIVFDSDRTKLHINDVGGQVWEEINLGRRGADYGWNLCEGDNQPQSATKSCRETRFVAPVFSYRHTDALRSITGGAFVPDDSAWPDRFDGGYLFADLGGGIYLMPAGNVPLADPEITAENPIHLVFREDALYYSDIRFGQPTGAIFRVEAERAAP